MATVSEQSLESWPPSPAVGYAAAFGLSLAMAVGMSLARFAYALVLPAMRNDLAWSYTEAGALNTINAVGYLAGAILAVATVRRLGSKMPFIVGLWVTSLTVLATAFVRDFTIIALLRAFSGAAAAYVFVTGGVLAASVFAQDARRATSAIAIYFAGGGLGLFVTALTIPWLLDARGDAAWPDAWLLLGLMSVVMSAIATFAARPVNVAPRTRQPMPWSKGAMTPLFIGYGCFALGYFAYMTFVVAWMRELGMNGSEIAMVWAALGLSTILSIHIWARPFAIWPGGRAFAAVMATVGVGAALPLVGGGLPVMIISALLFGCFFMVPAAITAFIKASLPPVLWGEVFAAFTLVFSILQCFGPAATGYLADITGSLAAGLGISAALLLIGAVAGWAQRQVA
ncbi:MAG TPA: YbfB/YjiJ family MFS transporter [Hyphomicrobiaceae bacterium]|nr:YbfB/YjiJ family MFS transporter [Hyphomicrobiaceae bacterium]